MDSRVQSNLSLFSENISTHYAFGVSAMAYPVLRGPLVGRPYGGVSVIIIFFYIPGSIDPRG